MSETAAYGFAPLKDLRPYDGEKDPLYQQDDKVITRHRKEFIEGLKLMQLEETEDYRFFHALYSPGNDVEEEVPSAGRKQKKRGRKSSSQSRPHNTSRDAYVMVRCAENKYFGKRLLRDFPDSSGVVRPYEGRVVGYLPEEKITGWFSYPPMFHVHYSEDEDEEDLSERSLQEAIRRFDTQPDLVRSCRRMKVASSSSSAPTKAIDVDALSQTSLTLLNFGGAEDGSHADKKPRADMDLWTLDDYQDNGSSLPDNSLEPPPPHRSAAEAHHRSLSPASEIAALSVDLCALEAEQAQLQERLNANLDKQKLTKSKIRWLTLNSFDA